MREASRLWRDVKSRAGPAARRPEGEFGRHERRFNPTWPWTHTRAGLRQSSPRAEHRALVSPSELLIYPMYQVMPLTQARPTGPVASFWSLSILAFKGEADRLCPQDMLRGSDEKART